MTTRVHLDDVAVPLLVVDSDGLVTDANREAVSLWGEPVGRVLESLIAGPDLAGSGLATPPTIVQLAGTEPPRHAEVGARPTSGGLVVSVRDVSDRERVVQLLAMAAHATLLVDVEGAVAERPRAGGAPPRVPADQRHLSSPTTHLDHQLDDFVHPDDAPAVHVAIREAAVHSGEWRLADVRVRDADEWRSGGWSERETWLEGEVRVIDLRHEPNVGAIVVQLHRAVDVAGHTGRSVAPMHSLAEVTPIGIVAVSTDGMASYANELAREWLAADPDEPTAPWDWTGAVDAADRPALDAILLDAWGGQHGEATIGFDLDPTTRWFNITVAPQHDDHGEVIGAMASLQDVTGEILARRELEDVRRRLAHLAHHDPLTGILNRAAFVDRVDDALGRDAPDSVVGLLFCDLDGFKAVNDLHGHAAGDAVLIEIARRVEGAVRTTDAVGRFGGDELVVLVDELGRAQIEQLAGRLLDVIAAPIRHGDIDVTIGVSIGIALATVADTSRSLIRTADAAMYLAKQQGRGQVAVASTDGN